MFATATVALLAISLWLAPSAYATAPTVTSLGVISGSTAGGDSVTITGTSFTNITSVKFGNNEASFVVNSSSSITATTPAASAAGVVDVTITNNLGEKGIQYGSFVYIDATHVINKWIGGTSGNLTAWAVGTNWSKGVAPDSTDVIYINGGTYQPVFTMNAPTTFYGLTVGPSTSSTLNVNGGSLTNVLSFSSDTVVGKSGRITQTVGNTTTQVNSIVLSVNGKLTVASGGQINAANMGYSSGNGPGSGTGGGSGCSYAAYGSNGKAPYGDMKQPTDLGSGCNSSNGGGFVRIQTTDLQIDGTITVAGSNYASAGSVWINAAGTISGVSAGTVNATSTYGSGGRIAVYAASSTFAGKYYAYGQSSGAGAGTIFTKIGAQTYGTLTIDNNNYQAVQMTKEMSTGSIQYDDFHVNGGGIYELPSGATLTLASLPASTSSTYPGSIVMSGNLNVPDSTTLTNYKLIVGDGTYSDINPIIGSGSTLELRKSDPATPWSIQSLTINSGGILTHTANTSTDTYAANLNVSGTVTINSGGSISVNKKGYSAGNGPGKGMAKIGAGHGGNGYGYNATYGNAYGSITQPYESGSGGLDNGAGGGRIKIVAQNLVNNGTITSDGSGSGYTGSAGGAGGSTWIDVTSLSGSGWMSSYGGNDYGAGGGRIALYYDTNTMTGSILAFSNDSGTRGGAGTVYKKVHSHAYGALSVQATTGNGKYGDTPIVDTNSHYESLMVGNAASLVIGSGINLTTDALLASPSAPYPGYLQLNGTLTVPDGTTLTNYYVYDNGTYSDQNPIIGSGTTFELRNTDNTTSWNVASLTINSGGLLTHPANSTAETYAVNVVATNDITLNSGANINVQAKGYTCSNGPGTGGPYAAASTYANGGSYGGAGGRPDTSQPTVLYGSATQPTNSGSGGACDSTGANSGSGGGVVMLKSTAGNIVVNGTVNANGGNGAWTYGAGGSGGSIWLQGNKVSGNGTLSANGGSPYSAAGAAGGGGRIAFTYSNNLQVISSTPNNGLVAGGNTVTLSGDGFTPTTLINFGANAATNISYTNVNTLTATVPAAATNGYVDIIAKNKYFNGTTASNAGINSTNYPGTAGSIDPAGTYQVATLTNGYQYGVQAPQISSISPNYGVPAGGNSVTINGQNFMTGATVTFGGVAATNVNFVSSTQLTATVPAHTVGNVDVTVTNTDNGTVTATGAYTYSDMPTISGVSPGTGTTAGGDTVIISGTHFTAGMTVKFGSNSATSVSVVNDTTISAVTPAGTRGFTDVIVANAFTQSATLTNGFQYLSPAPTITSFTPMVGTMAGGTMVTFSGSNFDATMKAYFNGQAGTTTSSSASALTVKTPAGQLGDATVTISGPDTEQVTASSPFTYVPAAYSFTTFPTSLHETEAGLVRVEARDTNNQPILIVSDTSLTLTSSSATSQFSLSQNSGWGISSVTIPAGSDHVDFYVKDTVKGSATITATGPDSVSVSQSVTVSSRYMFLVSGISDPIAAGTPSSVTVQTVDWLGNPLNDYTGTIHFTSTDAFAHLPADFDFTSDMQGNHTFVNGITLTTNGEQSVTVTDTTDTNITGAQSNITVENGYSGPAAKLVVITDPQTVASNTSTSAITVQVQDTNGNPAPVPVDTTIYITSSTNTGSFRPDESAAWTAGTTFQVTIPANTTATSLYYKDTVIGTATLSFRDQASTTDTALTDTDQTETFGAGTPYRLAMTTQDSQLANKWNPITVTLRDDQDRTLTIGQNASTVYLTSANSSLQFADDSSGSGATTTYAKRLVTGSNRLVVYVNSASAQQVNIHLSDSQPADGATGLLDDDKLINFVTQQATHISFAAATTVAADEVTPVTITALNDNGDAAPVVGNKTISLSSSSTGVYSLSSSPWSTTSSIVMPDGASSTTVYYRNQTAGTASLHLDSVLGQANRSITITAGTYTTVGISGSVTVPVDTPSAYGISLRDAFGNQTTAASDTTVYLYTTSTTGKYGSTANGPWTASSVTIPAGASMENIYYLDSTLGQNDTLTVSDQTPLDNPDVGQANGTLAITTVGQAVDHLSFTTAVQAIIAGQHSGVITIEARTTTNQPARVGSDLVLNLSSSSTGQPAFYADASGNTPVSSVTIPAGDSQISFYYADTKAGTYTLRALSGSGFQATQQINVTAGSVTDNGTLIFTTPAQTKESGAPSDTIRIATADKYGNEAPAVADTVVTLSSDCAGTYSLSATPWNEISSVTIATGQSAASVYFKSDVTCKMTLSAAGFADGQQTYTIQNGPYRLVLSGPATLELNQSGTYTISLQDINGNAVASTVNRTVYLSGNGLEPATSSFILLAGQMSQSIQARATTLGSVTLIARDEANDAAPDTGLVNASATTTVNEGTPTALSITSLTPSPAADALTHVSVQLINSSGGAVSAPSDTTITLSSTDASGAFHATNNTGSPVITTIVLPQGTSTIDVYYSQTHAGQAYLRATSGSYATGELDLTTNSGAVVTYQLTASTNTIELGETVNYTVSALDANGNIVVLHYGDSFYIDYAGGTISSSQFNTSTHQYNVGGTTTAISFGLTATTVGTYTTTISDTYPLTQPDTGVTDASHNLTIVNGQPAKLAITTPTRTIERGGVSETITIQLQNAHSAATTSTSDTFVTVHTSSSVGKFATSTGGPWTETTFSIPAGSSTLTVYYSDTSQPATWQLQATATGLTQATQSLVVVSGPAVSLHFVNVPSSLVSYHDSPAFMVELHNRYGYPTNKQNSDNVVLATDAAHGEFADSQHHWQTSVVPWHSATTVGYSPAMYYRSYMTGQNVITATLPGITAAQQTIDIVPQIMDHFVVTNVSDPTKVGVPSSIVVIAKDAAGYTVPSYDGTIYFAASDPDTTLPSPYTFVPPTDRGTHTFTNAVRFANPGEKSIVVSDPALGISGVQHNISVLGASTSIDQTPQEPTTTPEQEQPNDGAGNGSDNSNGGTDNGGKPGGSSAPSIGISSIPRQMWHSMTATLGAVGDVAQQLLTAKAAPYAAPTAVYGVFFGYSLVFALAGFRDARNARLLAALLRREKQTAHEKNEFINLLSHHLRTPMATIAGLLDLAAFTQKDRDISSLKAMSSRLGQDIDMVVSTTSQEVESIQVTVRQPATHVYRTWRFWAPVLLAVSATIAINVAINSAAAHRVHAAAYVYQAAIAVVAITVLYVVLRSHSLRKRELHEMRREHNMRQQLDQAKNDALAQLAHSIDSDLVSFETVIHDAANTEIANRDKIEAAESQLAHISSTAKLISTAPTTGTALSKLALKPFLDGYIANRTADLTHVLRYEAAIAQDVSIAVDQRILTQVLDSVLDNADKYTSGEAPIVAHASTHHHEVVITVTNQGNSLPDDVAHLDKPFMRAEDTLNESVQGLGLSLYADKLVLSSVGGSIAISAQDGTISTIVRLPIVK